MRTIEGKALVVYVHGRGYVVSWAGAEHITRFIDNAIGFPDSFALDEVGLEHAIPGDGLWIGELELADGGAGDYPGARELILQLIQVRPATKEEWEAHYDGQWPWEETWPPSGGVESIRVVGLS